MDSVINVPNLTYLDIKKSSLEHFFVQKKRNFAAIMSAAIVGYTVMMQDNEVIAKTAQRDID